MSRLTPRPSQACVAAVVALVAASLIVLPGWPMQAGAESDAEHLSFFRHNRDFVLRAFERIPRADAPDAARRDWDFDPFAAWSAEAHVRAVRAALDSATTPEDLEAFRLTLGSLLDESAAAAARLDELDRLFRAHLRTAVEVTLESRADVERIEAWLDGEHVADHTLSVSERSALSAGGILEVLRRVVEPRTQEFELRVWLAGSDAPRLSKQVVEPAADALRRLHFRVAADEPHVHVEVSTLGGS